MLAWALVRSLPGTVPPEERFDQLQLREALGAIFSTGGMEGEDVWRAAARVRVLLAHGDQPVRVVAYARSFWEDPDVRWLAGVNESGGKAYFNQEATDELLLAWMALPLLLAAAECGEPTAELLRLEEVVAALSASAKESGYELHRLLANPPAEEGIPISGGGAAVAEELPVEGVVPGKKIAKSEVDGDRRG